MSLSAYVVWFTLASGIGWVYESAYSVVVTGKWERRGFLYGPLCPIYGAGLVGALLLFNRPEVASGAFPAWGVFLISMAGSALLEYAVSFALERMFGAVWWDYSDMPLNLNGRICLPASLLFGAAGLLVAYVLAPILNEATVSLDPGVFEALALISVGLIAADTTATVISLSDLADTIAGIDESANAHASMRVERAIGAARSVSERVGEGTRSAVGHVKDGGREVASRIGEARGSAAEKMGEAFAEQQTRLNRAAAQLTGRQAHLLAQMRRFRSEDIRGRVEALRRAVTERIEANGVGRGLHDDGDK